MGYRVVGAPVGEGVGRERSGNRGVAKFDTADLPHRQRRVQDILPRHRPDAVDRPLVEVVAVLEADLDADVLARVGVGGVVVGGGGPGDVGISEEGVDEHLVVCRVRHEHLVAVGPDFLWETVIRVQVEVVPRVPALVRHPVGVDLVVICVGHPHRRAVGPDSRRCVVVGRVQGVEVLGGVPGAGRPVVGEDLAIGRHFVLGHPDGVVVAPDPARHVVGVVEGDVLPAVVGLVGHVVGVEL